MTTERAWWACPNDPPCDHPSVVHDWEDFEGDNPTCCVDGCGCGKPSESRYEQGEGRQQVRDAAGERAGQVCGSPSPSPYELWRQAGGDGVRYRQLMREHGWLIPGRREPLPCGWSHQSVGGEASDASPAPPAPPVTPA